LFLLSQVDAILHEAAKECVYMYKAQMSSMTESQAFAALAKEKWDDFNMV